MLELPPLSLYVHLPWCVKKCPYCDFNSHQRDQALSPSQDSATFQADSGLPEADYLSALMRDLEQDLPFVQGRSIQSIFFGGGTPSLMSGEFYLRLLEALQSKLAFAGDIEITLEANPGTVDAAHFRAYAEAGVNRISLGVQSFNDAQLQHLGRIHCAEDIPRAVEAISNAGIDNFNLDLMHGLPDQSPELAMADLEAAFALQPSHVSWYQLTIEPNTEFYSRPPALPDDEQLWCIIEAGNALLGEHGYAQYEVSAFAQPDMQARHNVNYWQFGDYIGLGAGAHSKITDGDSGRLLRYRKSRMPDAYMANRVVYRIGEEVIEPEVQAFEFMMNALRLKRGVSDALLEQRTQLRLADIQQQRAELERKGLMHAGRLKLTERGFLFLNSALEAFL